MANENRLTFNGFYGQLSADITAVATSITNAAFATLPQITGTADYIPLTLSDETLRYIEVVWITAHATGSNTVTVVRAKEGTTARAWLTGTKFGQADLVRDGLPSYLSSAIPTDLHVGCRFYVSDLGLVLVKSFNAGNVADVGVARPGDVGPTRAGTYPSAASVITVRAGNTVVSTNVNGDGSVNFLTAFPNGCISVTANSADPGVFTGTLTLSGEVAAGFNFRAMNLNNTPLASSPVRLNYTAIGW